MTLWLEADDPPAGRLQTAAASSVPFVGWLELLARLSQVFDDATHTQEKEQRS